MLSLGCTILSAVLIVGRQLTSWLETGEWDAFTISSVVKSLYQSSTYTTAGAEKSGPKLADWILDIPVIVPGLLIALTLHLAFFLWLTYIEKPDSTN